MIIAALPYTTSPTFDTPSEWGYFYGMKVKTCLTLSEELLKAVDKHAMQKNPIRVHRNDDLRGFHLFRADYHFCV